MSKEEEKGSGLDKQTWLYIEGGCVILGIILIVTCCLVWFKCYKKPPPVAFKEAKEEDVNHRFKRFGETPDGMDNDGMDFE